MIRLLIAFVFGIATLTAGAATRTISVTNSGAATLSNYAVRVPVAWTNGMRDDFADVRFYDSDNTTALSYWLETPTNSVSALAWVKVPSLTGAAARTIYLRYATGETTSTADGSAVFNLFDDFNASAPSWRYAARDETYKRLYPAPFGNLLTDTQGRTVVDGQGNTWLYALASGTRAMTVNLDTLEVGPATIIKGLDSGSTWASAHLVIEVSTNFYVMFYSANTSNGKSVRIATNSAPNTTFTRYTPFDIIASSGWETAGGDQWLESGIRYILDSETATNLSMWIGIENADTHRMGWSRVVLDKTTGAFTEAERYANNPLNALIFGSDVYAYGGGNMDQTGLNLGTTNLMLYEGRLGVTDYINYAFSTNKFFDTVQEVGRWDGLLNNEVMIEKYQWVMRNGAMLLFYQLQQPLDQKNSVVRRYWPGEPPNASRWAVGSLGKQRVAGGRLSTFLYSDNVALADMVSQSTFGTGTAVRYRLAAGTTNKVEQSGFRNASATGAGVVLEHRSDGNFRAFITDGTTSSGTNLGTIDYGWHTIDLGRTSTKVKVEWDGQPKGELTTGLTTSALKVLASGYKGPPGYSSVRDFILVRPFTDPEPAATVVSDTGAPVYYVSPTGSDATGDGSAGAPWATLLKATNLIPGTLVRVQPGNYTNAEFVIRSRGTPSSPIVFLADGTVTNWFRWAFNGSSNIIVSGFHHATDVSTNHYDGRVWLEKNARNITITNCFFWRGSISMDQAYNVIPELAGPHGMTVVDCVIQGITGGTFMNLHGINHTVERTVFRDGKSSDAFRVFGSNHVFRACTFTNLYAAADAEDIGNHPDIFQTWGSEGRWLVDFVFERNLVIDCPIQMCQVVQDDGGGYGSYTPSTDPNLWGITLRNNKFIRGDMAASVSIPNFRVYNNTFYQTTGELNYSFYDPGFYTWRGSAYGGVVRNNAWIGCAATYSTALPPVKSGPLTTTEAGGGARQGRGYANVQLKSNSSGGSSYSILGWATNLSGAITGINLEKYSDGTVIYPLPESIVRSIVGNSNYFTASFDAVDTNGFTVIGQYGVYNGDNLAIRILTDTFPAGEVRGRIAQFQPDPPADLNSNAGWNYSGTLSGGATTHPVGTNGFRGGVTNLTATLAPMQGSPLIDAGTAIAGVSVDFDGTRRPMLGALDIGAYEYGDPDLVLYIPFEGNFTNAGYAFDYSGLGNHAWRMNTTNWITPTNGVFGGQAARFNVNFFSTNGLNWYASSQYGAVTNLSGLQRLPKATISFWGAFTHKPGPQQITYVIDAAARNDTNSWRIGRLQVPNQDRMSMRVYRAGTTDTDGDLLVSWPPNTIGGTSNTSTTNGLEHYAVTFDGEAGKVIAYLNGVPRSTNSTTVPWLSVSDGNPTPWICIGAHKYGNQGSYTWETEDDPDGDGFPNDAYIHGVTDDFRIHARVLNPAEIAALWGTGDPPPPIEEPEPEPPSIVAVPQSVTVEQGNSATFTVIAAGTAPLSYQWQKLSGTYGNISGATGSTLTLLNVQPSAATQYRVVVSNSYGSVTSPAATLTVTTEPIPPPEALSIIQGSGEITGSGQF